MKALEFDLQKTLIRIQEVEKIIDGSSFDIQNKRVSLDDCEKEIARLKDLNNGQSIEIGALRKDVDRVSTDCYDLRKHIETTENSNVNISNNIRSHDINIKDKEEGIYANKKDIET